MSTKRLQELLNSDKNSIKINKDLLKTLDLEEAVLYSFLVYEFDKNSKHYENKYFDGDKYFLCPVDDIENELNLSAFRQRNALNKLQDKGLLEIKLGQYRTRYIHLNENPEILERILYGVAISDFQKAFNKYLEEQVETFKVKNNLYINSKYLIDYATPWETKLSITKHIDLNKNFSELGLGWLAKNSSKIETNSDKIRA